MEIDMFGDVLKDDDLAAELEALEAEDAAGQMEGPIGSGAISAADAEAYRQEHGIVAPQAQPAQAQPAQEAAPERQLIAA